MNINVSVNSCILFQVARHLTKLFDSMAALEFKQDGQGNNTKTALKMFSKDDECVALHAACECTGQVSGQ